MNNEEIKKAEYKAFVKESKVFMKTVKKADREWYAYPSYEDWKIYSYLLEQEKTNPSI